MGLLRRIVSEEAPIMVFSFLNFYVALVVSIAMPVSELLIDKAKFAILKIPILMLLSVVVAQAYGKVTFLELSAPDLIGILVIIFWVHLYLNQKLQEVVVH